MDYNKEYKKQQPGKSKILNNTFKDTYSNFLVVFPLAMP